MEDDEIQNLSNEVLNDSNARDIVTTSHLRSVRLLAPEYNRRFQEAMTQAQPLMATGDPGDQLAAQQIIGDASADIMSIYDALGHESPAKQKQFAAQVFGTGIRDYVFGGGGMVTTRTVMERARNMPPGAPHGEQPVLERRREYSNREQADRADAGPPPEEG